MSKEYLDFYEYIKHNNLGSVLKEVDLKKYCTLKIGGKCFILYKPNCIDSLVKAYRFILINKLDYFIIGNGSNLLISDEYHSKIFICLKNLNKIMVNDTQLFVEAGVMGNVLSKKISELMLSGIEFLAGIPGTIGGMIYMNAGAWGKMISDILESVTYLDEFGKVCVMKNISSKGFSYRKSPFMKRKVIILSCVIRLFKDLTSFELFNSYLEKKKLIQPLNTFNAGCTFKNPPNNSAWKLIKETVGNISVADAKVSTIHANFLINEKNATFNDMKKLIVTIQDEVFKKYHILLETEWIIIE